MKFIKKLISASVLCFSLNSQATVMDTIPLPKINSFSELSFFSEEDCDACSCSTSGGSMGFGTIMNSDFIGVRYVNQQYKSKSALYTNEPWYEENFNTLQLWTRFPITTKLQISALIPFHFHERETSLGNQSLQGLGDVTVLAMYQIFKTANDSTAVNQDLKLGGGTKIPVGSFSVANSSSTNTNQSFQLGTGSWDYLTAVEYILQKGKLSLGTQVNYTLKSTNENFYRFGNQTNYAGTFSYVLDKSDYTWVPQLGVSGEIYESNYQHKQKINNTAGTVLFGKVGLEFGKDKLSFGANAFFPLQQNLANGNLQANYRLGFHLNVNL